MQSITVTKAEAGRRIDKYLLRFFDAAPRSFVYKAFRKKNIKLGGKRAAGDEVLAEGDIIELYFSDETIAGLRSRSTGGRSAAASTAKEKKPAGHSSKGCSRLTDYCDIVYEDEHIIIADKHYGVLSQKAGQGDYSLNEALLDYCRSDNSSTGDFGVGFVPSVVNRIDRNTTGLVCFAKTYGAARELSRLLKERGMHKYYIAAAAGTIREAAHRTAWLKKDLAANRAAVSIHAGDGAERIETAYRPIDEAEARSLGLASAFGQVCGTDYTILKIELITGKSHQIRAHLAELGHPLLGDPKYGSYELNKELLAKYGIKAQLLHAYEIDMPQQLRAPLEYLGGHHFCARLPQGFASLQHKN